MARGTVSETYHAALVHDLVDLPREAIRIGVVRRPTHWFLGTVEENDPNLGPPEELLEEFQNRREDLGMQGMCDEGAHNAAWKECDFETRYREHLDTSAAANAALSGLVDRIANGEQVVLVCYESDAKQCHRHILVDEVRDRINADA